MTADLVVGRDPELAAIASFLDDDRPGPRALVLEGVAGIGKSTLWREGLRLARRKGLALSSRASETETALAYTVLGDLLEPVIAGPLGDLPPGQRGALEAALLLGPPAGTRPDARAVSLAVLAVFRILAADGPLAIAIDDVQWTDPSSAQPLAFAIRRLNDSDVSVLAAERVATGLHDPLGLSTTLRSSSVRVPVGPVDPGPLGHLLREHLGRHFSPPLVLRIHGASGGNPLYALEIGRALGTEEPNPRPGEPLPVPNDLAGLLRHRVSALSERARHVLLVVASSARPSAAIVQGAGGDPAALNEAEDAGILVRLGGEIAFTHPLLASTAYTGASSRARREVHALLARLTGDQEERARHLALSIEGPDDRVAAILEEAARHAESRGAPLAASDLYQLAATATSLDQVEARRLRRHGALGNLWAAGDVVGARALNERLLADLAPGPGRAHTLWVMASTCWNDVSRVAALCERALDEIGDDHVTRALLIQELAWCALLSCDVASAATLANEAMEQAERLDAPNALSAIITIRAMAGAALGHDTWDLIERGISLGSAPDYSELGTPRIGLAQLQMWAGALGAARATLEEELGRRLDHGHASVTWEVRADLAEVGLREGSWELAAQDASEAVEILAEAGWSDMLSEVLPIQAAVAAARGASDEARALGIEALSVCERLGDRWAGIHARSALGFLELSLGDHAACHAWLEPLIELTETMGLREPGAFPFVPDEVEALVALGDLRTALALTERLEEQGRALDRPLALATAARCRGLIAGARREPHQAEEHLREAIDQHTSVPQPFELGRTLLVAGSVDRAARRWASARDRLDDGLRIFEALGAPLWTAKARTELDRIGGRAPSGPELTPAEEQVARLVASGRTNREVAAMLVMSVHTVDAHLRRIYRKLQVRSRTELAHKL